MLWQRLAESRIESALRAGEFDGLPGSGQPLALLSESAIDPEMWAAFHLLQGAGLAPAWIELDRELRREMEAARRELRRRGGGRAARQRFQERVAEVNRQIDRLNLLVPALSLQRAHFDAGREAERALVSRENEEPA